MFEGQVTALVREAASLERLLSLLVRFCISLSERRLTLARRELITPRLVADKRSVLVPLVELAITLTVVTLALVTQPFVSEVLAELSSA
jgi:hypothetical protein